MRIKLPQKPSTMYFCYYEKGYGELCFGATISPFRLTFSDMLTDVFFIGLS
jgi:hypothetical protein